MTTKLTICVASAFYDLWSKKRRKAVAFYDETNTPLHTCATVCSLIIESILIILNRSLIIWHPFQRFTLLMLIYIIRTA